MKPIRPDFGFTKPSEWIKEAETLTKITISSLQTFRKHKLLVPLKSLAIVWKLCTFIPFSKFTNSDKIILNEKISSIGPYLKIIWICYYAIVLKEHKYTTHIIFYQNAFCQTNKTSFISENW